MTTSPPSQHTKQFCSLMCPRCTPPALAALLALGLLTMVGCRPPGADTDGGNNTDPTITAEETPAAETRAETPVEETPAEPPAAPAPSEPAPAASVGKAPPAAATKVLLGSSDLTAGIPGDGELTVADIQKWLDDPANHEALDVELPAGLSKGAAMISGIDKVAMTRAKIELGRQLYFDTRLSSDNTVSCASCHDPDEGFARHTQFGVGVDGQTGGRNAPVSYNRLLSGPQFWDGRAESLEAQAVGPIANPIEMGNTHEKCVETLAGIDGYKMQFEKVFPGAGVTIDNVGKAIATFERAIVTEPAPYDHYELVRSIESQLEEDEIADLEEEDPTLFARYEAAVEGAKPMSESARRGRELFFAEKSNCTACHAGANFTDEKYHNLGVGMDAEEPDFGRFEITHDDKDRGAFKTPTLRNVATSGPYMHDGSQKTLEEVVEWYAKGGHPNDHLSDKIKKLELSDQDKKDLVTFMQEGLTCAFPRINTGRLPQ